MRFWRSAALGGVELICASCGPDSFAKHFHEEYSITLMVCGIERFRHGRTTDFAPAGSLILVNPGEVHQKVSVKKTRFSYQTLFVPAPVVERGLRETGYRPTALPTLRGSVVSDSDLFVAFRKLHSAVELGEPLIRLQSELMAGIARLFRRHGAMPAPLDPPRPSRSTINRVKDYLDAHFAQGVSLADLARVAGLSSYHLVRSFKEAVGLPPCQYLIQRRVLHALARLRQGMPIAQAASESGFVDQSHLNRHIKRILGITPGQFQATRKSVQDRSQP
jgi:AraC-like DNA-binding protein